MTEQPYVELFFGGGALAEEARALDWAQSLRGDPVHTVHHALVNARLGMIREAKEEVNKNPNAYATVSGARTLLDALWKTRLPGFKRILVPMIAAEYASAFRKAKAGIVDPRLVNTLAEEHAARMGAYFHETSREALIQGFSTYVNRKVPARVALDRALDAYGLTSRQVSGLTAMAEPEAVASARPRSLKAKVSEYISRSITQRLGIFSKQEAHNLDMQASQVAWMWMVEHGQMSETAEKVWYTEKDERVCPVCGPLHGMVVLVTEQFTTDDGTKFWVPGAHVNCRCWVKVREPLKNHIQPVRKDLYGNDLHEFNQNHPRGEGGRFTAKNRHAATRTKERPTGNIIEPAQEIPTVRPELKSKPELRSRELTGIRPELGKPELRSRELTSSGTAKPELSTASQAARPELGRKELVQQRPELVSVKPELTSAFAKPEIRQDLKQALSQRAELPKVETKPVTRPENKPSYVWDTNYVAFEAPMYAVVTPSFDFSGDPTDHRKMRMTNGGAVLHDNLDAVVDEANALHQEKIDESIRTLMENPMISMNEVDTNAPVGLYAALTQEDIEGAVNWAAHQGRLTDTDSTGDGMTKIVWRGEDNSAQYPDVVSYSQLSEMLGLDPDDYEVGIVQVDKAPEDTTDVRPDFTHRGGLSATTDGMFDVKWDGREKVGYGMAIEFFVATPENEDE